MREWFKAPRYEQRPMTAHKGLDMLELAIMRRFGKFGKRRDLLEAWVGAELDGKMA